MPWFSSFCDSLHKMAFVQACKQRDCVSVDFWNSGICPDPAVSGLIASWWLSWMLLGGPFMKTLWVSCCHLAHYAPERHHCTSTQLKAWLNLAPLFLCWHSHWHVTSCERVNWQQNRIVNESSLAALSHHNMTQLQSQPGTGQQTRGLCLESGDIRSPLSSPLQLLKLAAKLAS